MAQVISYITCIRSTKYIHILKFTLHMLNLDSMNKCYDISEILNKVAIEVL